MRDGKTVRGRVLNQDTQSIQMLGPGDKPLSVARTGIRSVAEEKSSMPSAKDKLNAQELADVVSYLQTLKGIQ
jgi:mono/diheme cytochrome c family protein